MNSTETPLEPELRTYLDQLTAIERDARRLIDGLTDVQLAWRESVSTWSVADCLNHLMVTGGHSLASIRRALVDARARGSLRRGPFRHGMLGNWFVRLMDAPPPMKFKAPKAYRPVPELSASEILNGFFALQRDFANALAEADGIDLSRVKIDNPVTRWFRLSLGQEFALTMAHQRRHVWQAWKVRERLTATASGFAHAN